MLFVVRKKHGYNASDLATPGIQHGQEDPQPIGIFETGGLGRGLLRMLGEVQVRLFCHLTVGSLIQIVAEAMPMRSQLCSSVPLVKSELLSSLVCGDTVLIDEAL